MALTIAADDAAGLNYDFNARAAKKNMIIVGSWSFPSTYKSSGVEVPLACCGMGGVHFAYFEAHDRERRYIYDYTTSMLLAYRITPTTTALGSSAWVEYASDSAFTGDGGYFVAFGTQDPVD